MTSKDIVIGASAGIPTRIADVATVMSGALPRQGAVTKDGVGEVVSGMVLKLKGADSRRVIKAVRARMEEIRAAIPPHVEITPFYDQTDLVSRTTHTLTKNLIEGGLLVIAILFLFLRNVRASLIVASVIPLSMLLAFGPMYIFGYSANLMSLGALDFGLIVDASVVMVENFVRRLETGKESERLTLFRSAALEVGRPILFGIAIIVAVYLPIFALDGMEGRMFKPMAFTVVTAVLGSLILALTYVPSVCAWLLHHKDEVASPFFESLNRRYARGLDWVLAHGTRVVAIALVLVVSAVASLRWIGTEFMPRLNEGSILITTRRLPSISLADATRLSLQAERIVKSLPEVVTVVTKEGRPDLATEAMGLFEGDMYVILKPLDEWTTAKTPEGLVEVARLGARRHSRAGDLVHPAARHAPRRGRERDQDRPRDQGRQQRHREQPAPCIAHPVGHQHRSGKRRRVGRGQRRLRTGGDPRGPGGARALRHLGLRRAAHPRALDGGARGE